MVVLLLAWSADPACAHPPGPPAVASSSDTVAIHRLIDGQIAAFEVGDARAAWKYVSPGLQEQFGTPEAFLGVVLRGYRPVANPRGYTYGELEALPPDEFGEGALGQWLDVVGPDGERVRALYLLERQPDGSWRTSGCLLFAPGPPRTAV